MLDRALWVAVAVAAVLRLAGYASNRSLWLDESLLALNIVSKSASGLLGSLDYVQSAPPGFLLVERAAVQLFGERELALRLFPLLASLAAIVLFALVARRLLRTEGALLAVALFGVNEALVYQASETKPYSSDVAVGLILAWLTLRALESRAFSGRDIVALAVAGVVGVTISYPAVFVAAAAGVSLLLDALWRRDRRDLSVLALLGAAWATAFLIVYFTSADTIAAVRAPIFGEGGGRPDALALARSAWHALAEPGGFERVPHLVAALLIVPGAIGLVRREGVARLALVAGPIMVALAAAAIDRYPLGGRFSLFLVPFLLLLVAEGVSEIAARVGGSVRRPAVLAAVALLLLAMPVRHALTTAVDPIRTEDVRPLLERVVREWRPGDAIYVFRNTQYAFRYYGECGDCGVAPLPFELRAPSRPIDNDGTPVALVTRPPEVLIGVLDDAIRLTPNIELIEGRTRVWALFSHVGVGNDSPLEDDMILGRLDERGRRLGSWSEPGADLYLYRVGP